MERRRRRRRGGPGPPPRGLRPPALPVPALAVPLLALCCAAAAERHTVFWNSSNARLLRGDYTVTVRLNDHLDIICPHSEGRGGAGGERYALYLVGREEFGACAPRSAAQLRWQCDRPHAPHGPERFSEKFQRFTPLPLGKEFEEGQSYYYISKPIRHHGESCLKLRVTVAGKGTPAPAFPAATRKGRIQADDAAAHVLRSVGHNAALRATSPLALLSLLLPLLVPPGL
ncbi:ephrin-A1 [Eudromia elegans]